jgi:hypothetical protein
LLAAVVMAGGLYPIEHLVIDAGAHGTLVGLVLLTAEGLLGAAIYVGTLSLVAPATGGAIVRLPAVLLRRARSSA